MNKEYRNNRQDRKKVTDDVEVFEQKTSRRSRTHVKCTACGTDVRPDKCRNGLCPACITLYGEYS